MKRNCQSIYDSKNTQQEVFRCHPQDTKYYLGGYEAWLVRIGETDAPQIAARRRAIFMRLKANPDGPYSVPWQTELNWMPGTKAERQVVRRVLFRYRP